MAETALACSPFCILGFCAVVNILGLLGFCLSGLNVSHKFLLFLLHVLLFFALQSLTFLYTECTFVIVLAENNKQQTIWQWQLSEMDATHRYHMNIVRLSLFCLNGTIWKNMDLCVAFATYFYLFLCCMFGFLSLPCSSLYYLQKITFITMINFEVQEWSLIFSNVSVLIMVTYHRVQNPCRRYSWHLCLYRLKIKTIYF